MGQRGPTEKRTGRQRRPSTSKVIQLVPGASNTAAPAASKDWLAVTRDAWLAFWCSDVSKLVNVAHRPALQRLFDLYDERERAASAAKKKRIVLGSQGQPVLNPLLKYVADCDKEIRGLEDRFGLTPMAMLRAGATFGEAAKSLEAMNGAFDDDAPQTSPDEDPRRQAIDA